MIMLNKFYISDDILNVSVRYIAGTLSFLCFSLLWEFLSHRFISEKWILIDPLAILSYEKVFRKSWTTYHVKYKIESYVTRTIFVTIYIVHTFVVIINTGHNDPFRLSILLSFCIYTLHFILISSYQMFFCWYYKSSWTIILSSM